MFNIILAALAMSLASIPPKTETISFNLGKTKCNILCTLKPGQDKSKSYTFIALHENEKSCITAFDNFKSKIQCKLFQLHQSGERLISLELNGKIMKFDPNRIFSENGITNSLVLYNKIVVDSSSSIVKDFSKSILDLILPKNENTLIALHNNTNNGYSINQYANLKNADSIFINNLLDPDDFFLVTNKNDYKFLKSKKQNVVLQFSKSENDGSLSNYCRVKKIRYINIEAENGHISQQTFMLNFINELFTDEGY
jgi:hypothetical protein